jgi:hypothetical protein
MATIYEDIPEEGQPAPPAGIVEDLKKTLRSIPHLPAALTRGLNEEGVSAEELDLRRKALATAAEFVIPSLIGGGAGLIFRSALRPTVAAIVNAAAFGAGAGTAAAIEGEEVAPAAAIGAGLGGAFGLLPLMRKGAKLAADDLLDAATAEAADATEGMARKIAKLEEADPSIKGKLTAGPKGPELSGAPATSGGEPFRAAFLQGESILPVSQPEALAVWHEGRKVLPKFAPMKGKIKTKPMNLPPTQLDYLTDGPQLEMWGPGSSAKVQPVLSSANPPATQLALKLRGVHPEELVEDAVVRPGAPTGGPFSPEQTLKAAVEVAKDGLTGTGASLRKAGMAPILEDAIELVHRAVAPARVTLRRMGPLGAKMASMIDEAYDAWRMTAGADIAEVRNVLKPFDKATRIHIGEVMEGIAVPRDEKVRAAADALADVYDRYAQDSIKAGMRQYIGPGDVQEFRPRQNYLTHYYSEDTIKKYLTPGSKEYKHAMHVLEGYAEGANKRQREALLTEMFRKTPSEWRTGPINFQRDHFLPGYDKDPLTVMSRYIFAVRKRLEMAGRFGADWRIAREMAEQIGAEGGNTKSALAIFNAAADAAPKDYPDLVKAAKTWNVLTMLSTSGAVQPAQLLNTAAVVGYGNLFKALGVVFNKGTKARGVEWAESTGAMINETLQDIIGTDNELAQIWVRKVIGLEPFDKANRIVSAIAGRFHAIEQAKRFAQRQTTRGADQLRKLGLDPEVVLAQKGILTPNQLKLAGYRTSIDTQFGSAILDLPEFRNSLGGQFVYQFKSFALQQANFVQKEVLAPAKKAILGQKGGDLRPLIRFSSGMAMVGPTIGMLVRSFKGRPAPDDERLKLLDNLALVGAFGVFYDVWSSFGRNKEGVYSLFAGPAASELAGFVAEGAKLAKDQDPKPLLKHAFSRIPLIGQPLTNYWLYPRE